jgi:RNA polymerase sigma factor (sigma-70 family)
VPALLLQPVPPWMLRRPRVRRSLRHRRRRLPDGLCLRGPRCGPPSGLRRRVLVRPQPALRRLCLWQRLRLLGSGAMATTLSQLAPPVLAPPGAPREPAREPALPANRPALQASGPALAELGRHRAQFVAFARRRVATNADAEDLVQQAFARAAEKLGDLRDPQRARAWFFRVLRRLVIDQYARRALRERKLQELGPSVEAATPEEAASCACALGLLEALRPEYADIVKRVDLDDQSVDQVAVTLGISANNASVRLHRARARLRADLQALCGPGPDPARAPCGACDCPPAAAGAAAAPPTVPGPRPLRA